MGVRGLVFAAAMMVASIGSSVTPAEDGILPTCPLVLYQARVDSVEQELAVDLAASRLAAADAIFALVNQLWENDAVEQIVYLAAKHDRDVAKIELTRQRLLLKRQEVEVEEYEVDCSAPGSDNTAADRRGRLDEIRRRYLQIDCHRLGKDLAISEIDLAYNTEVLASVQGHRERNTATVQNVIRAERDVEMARKRVDHQGRRVRDCVNSGVASGDGPG